MGSLRVQLKNILEESQRAHEQEDQVKGQKEFNEVIRRALKLADRKACAISYNLVGDLMVEQHQRLIRWSRFAPDVYAAEEVKHVAVQTLDKGIMNYRSSSMLEQAQNCVLTAAKLGHALIIAGKLDDAKSELERGRNINCPVDPILHHVEVNRESHIKEQLIAYTKKRIDSDLLYIDVSEEDGKFAMILRQLDKTRADDAHSVLKSAVDLASARPRSVRAQLLYPHIVLKLLVSGRLNDRSHDKSFSRALHILQDMSTLVPRSLVVSLLHAKLLVTLGHFDESEQECLRGLRIEMPDDPLSHDIPLASPSTDVAIYDDRVAQKRTQIACVLGTVVDMVKVEFSKLTEEQKGCFLAVKVTDLLDQSIAVMKVVEQYKFNNSWVLWRCQSEDCVFEAADPLALLLHLYGAHLFASDDDVEICYLTLCARLKSVHFVPLAGCHEDLYLARDSEGSDYVCVSSIESLFSGIHKVLSGLKGEEKEHIVSPVEALDRFMSHIVSDDEVVSDNALEESWRQLLASWAIDNRETLFELVANVKWLEMKKMVEKMIISMEIAGRDENEMPIEESLPEIKGPERSSGASNSQQQASRYAYGALHRRRAAVLPPPPSVETAKDADVYANGKTHTDYMDAAAKEPAHKQLCSACFFERYNDRSFIQIRFHFSDLHKVVGVDCPLCSFLFVTASALSYHMGFCHKVVAKGEEINVLTPD